MTSRSTTLRAVDKALRRPEVRAAFEDYKRLVAVATTFDASTVPHLDASIAASVQAHRTIDLIGTSEDLRLPVYLHLLNVAMEEMLPASGPGGSPRPRISMPMPAGRRRSGDRAAVIQRIRDEPRRPTDAQIEAIGRELDPGSWPDQDDYDARRKRIGRLRKAAKEDPTGQ